MNTLPIACNLTSTELQERRRTILKKLSDGVIEVKELANGLDYYFSAEGDRFKELAEVVLLERHCCPFLEFRVTVTAGGGPVRLEITGPVGTKEFLASTFEWEVS